MTTAMFDTLSYSKKLQAAGVPAQSADAQAEALSEVLEEKFASNMNEMKSDISNLKDDVNTLKHDVSHIQKDMVTMEERLNSRMNTLEGRLNSRMGTLEDRLTNKLTIRLGGMMGTGIILLAAMMKMIH